MPNTCRRLARKGHDVGLPAKFHVLTHCISVGCVSSRVLYGIKIREYTLKGIIRHILSAGDKAYRGIVMQASLLSGTRAQRLHLKESPHPTGQSSGIR